MTTARGVGGRDRRDGGPEVEEVGHHDLVPDGDGLAVRHVQDVCGVDEFDGLVDRYVVASTPASTIKAYSADVRHYAAWCADKGRDGSDPENVARYLAVLAVEGYKPTTIERRLSALCIAFKGAGYPSPRQNLRVVRTLRGIRRTHPHRPRQARALTLDELRRIIHRLPDTPDGVRDRCALLLGVHAALRRSELVAIDIEHLVFTELGIVLTIPGSKTDTLLNGTEIALPFGKSPATCPVHAVSAWLETSGNTTGPLLRRVDRWHNIGTNRMTPRSIGLLLSRAAERAGVPVERLTAHSLRSTWATNVAEAPERLIATHGRWRSPAVMRGYIRSATLFESHPNRCLDL